MKTTKILTILDELSENEIEHFFAEGNEEVVSTWTDGVGRGQSNYEIYKFGNVHVLMSEHYGFGDFNQPTYHFITWKPQE